MPQLRRRWAICVLSPPSLAIMLIVCGCGCVGRVGADGLRDDWVGKDGVSCVKGNGTVCGAGQPQHRVRHGGKSVFKDPNLGAAVFLPPCPLPLPLLYTATTTMLIGWLAEWGIARVSLRQCQRGYDDGQKFFGWNVF